MAVKRTLRKSIQKTAGGSRLEPPAATISFTSELLHCPELESGFLLILDNEDGDVVVDGVTILVELDALTNNRLGSRNVD